MECFKYPNIHPIHGITFCGFSINTVYDSKKELRTSRLTLKFPHCGTNDEMITFYTCIQNHTVKNSCGYSLPHIQILIYKIWDSLCSPSLIQCHHSTLKYHNLRNIHSHLPIHSDTAIRKLFLCDLTINRLDQIHDKHKA